MLNSEQKDKLKLIVESIDDKLTKEGYIFTARHFDVVMDGVSQLLKQCNVSGALPLKWSPVDSERKWQEDQFKRMFPNYPNDQPDWQRLNFFIEAGLEYLKLGRQ